MTTPRDTSDAMPGDEPESSLDGWKLMPADFSLSRHQIDVWRQPTDLSTAEVAEFSAVLSPEELKKANRLRDPAKRNESIIARGLLRRVLGRILSIDPRVIEFDTGPHGKPSLLRSRRKQRISFNLSHTQGMVLLAFAAEREVGVDIERVRADFDWPSVARQFLSADEAAFLLARPATQGREAFFTLWVTKEAALKAAGVGIGQGLQASAGRWTMFHPAIGAGYATAVAAEGSGVHLRQWRWG